jgi:hypothetical protein
LIVISDTSVINNLAAIHQLNLLQKLYSSIVIPQAVYDELTLPNFWVAGANEVQSYDWIQVRSVSNDSLLKSLEQELDIGESEAIALAIELKAELILIDERRARKIAEELNLRYTGILGTLIEAKDQGIILAVKPLLDSLINEAGFWIASSLYERVLQEVSENESGN